MTSDSTTSNAPEGPAAPPADATPPGEAGPRDVTASDPALKSLAALDTEATFTFRGATNLNDLLLLATRHCRRLVDCETARIWLLRRNGRRLVARDFPDDPAGAPVEHRRARGEGLAGWAITREQSVRLAPGDPRPPLKGEGAPFRSALVI